MMKRKNKKNRSSFRKLIPKLSLRFSKRKRKSTEQPQLVVLRSPKSVASLDFSSHKLEINNSPQPSSQYERSITSVANVDMVDHDVQVESIDAQHEPIKRTTNLTEAEHTNARISFDDDTCSSTNCEEVTGQNSGSKGEDDQRSSALKVDHHIGEQPKRMSINFEKGRNDTAIHETMPNDKSINIEQMQELSENEIGRADSIDEDGRTSSFLTWKLGLQVQVIKGKYVGQHGIFVGLTDTKKSVRLNLENGTKGKPFKPSLIIPMRKQKIVECYEKTGFVQSGKNEVLESRDQIGSKLVSDKEQIEIINDGRKEDTNKSVLVEGSYVKIIAGSYKGEHGIYRGLVGKKSVKIDLQDGSKVKRLRITSVHPFPISSEGISSSKEDTVLEPTASGASYNAKNKEPSNISDEIHERTRLEVKARTKAKDAEKQIPSRNGEISDFAVGDEVYIKGGGKHRDKIGTVKKICPKTIKVCFADNENIATIRRRFVIPISLRKESTEDFRLPEYREGGLRLGNQRVKKIVFDNGSLMEDSSFLHHMFGGRILIEQHSVKDISKTKVLIEDSTGRVFELVSTKVVQGEEGGFFYKPKEYQCVYMQTKGPGVTTVSVSSFLSSIASFESLPTIKAKARLELFQSPAHKLKSTGKHLLEFYDQKMFGYIAEKGHVGCGFICEELLKDLLNNDTFANKAICIQVRIYIPRKGVYKGMLMKKKIESGAKILLPESMKKIPASTKSDVSDKGCLKVVKAGVDPSSNNEAVGKLPSIDQDSNGPPNSYKPKGLGKMMLRLLKSLKVPDAVANNYDKMSIKKRSDVCHSFLRGVADPTGKIPANHVFITGISNAAHFPDQIFITRSPCIKASDGRRIKVVTKKPASMTDEDYQWLNSLYFGTVIFGFPEPECKSSPELIADGDLDGDRYFCCWDKIIMSHIEADLVTNENVLIIHEDAKVTNTCVEENDNIEYDSNDSEEKWLRDLQLQLVNPSITDDLISCLYKASEKAADGDKVNFMRNKDAEAFADAYYQALKNGKHGTKILLPEHLWSSIPEKLHKHLTEA